MTKAEDRMDETIVTSLEKLEKLQAVKAYILFISGPLKGKSHLISGDSCVIGRANDANIVVNDNRISRHHIKLNVKRDEIELEDLGSTNGTYVNGKKITKCILRNDDRVHLSGNTIFKFAYGDEIEIMFQKEMHQMANFDAVTGVYNKHYLTERLNEEFSFSKRNNVPISILMIDIDFFKKVNDTYGHIAGDYILHGVAQNLKKTLREEDILARYGGEEFMIIMRNSNLESAKILAERLRVGIENETYKFEGEKIKITISLGGASLTNANHETAEKLIDAADKNLYKSKKDGRNRATIG